MWSIASSYGSVLQRHYVVYILQDPSNHQEVRTILAWRLSPQEKPHRLLCYTPGATHCPMLG